MSSSGSPVMTAQQLSKKIGQLKQAIQVAVNNLRGQRCELWTFVYLFCETRGAKDDYTVTDCYLELEEQWGSNREYWGRCRRVGEFIRKNKIKTKNVKTSALVNVAARSSKFTAAHCKKLCDSLNLGVGPTYMDRLMSGMGYLPFKKQYEWSRAEVKQHKHGITDWALELAIWHSAVRKMCPKEELVVMTLTVNGKTIKVG